MATQFKSCNSIKLNTTQADQHNSMKLRQFHATHATSQTVHVSLNGPVLSVYNKESVLDKLSWPVRKQDQQHTQPQTHNNRGNVTHNQHQPQEV